ncbi:hypothetical protein ACLI1X_16625, partial [Enterococcus faecalis]
DAAALCAAVPLGVWLDGDRMSYIDMFGIEYGGCGDCDCDHGCQGVGSDDEAKFYPEASDD